MTSPVCKYLGTRKFEQRLNFFVNISLIPWKSKSPHFFMNKELYLGETCSQTIIRTRYYLYRYRLMAFIYLELSPSFNKTMDHKINIFRKKTVINYPAFIYLYHVFSVCETHVFLFVYWESLVYSKAVDLSYVCTWFQRSGCQALPCLSRTSHHREDMLPLTLREYLRRRSVQYDL